MADLSLASTTGGTKTMKPFVLADHSASYREAAELTTKCAMKRTLPKPTKDYNGNERLLLKMERDVSVVIPSTGVASKARGIVEISVSIPVGATAAERATLRELTVSLLGTTAAQSAFADQSIPQS